MSLIILFVLSFDFGKTYFQIEQVAPLLSRLSTLYMDLYATIVWRRWQRTLWAFVAFLTTILMITRKNEIVLT